MYTEFYNFIKMYTYDDDIIYVIFDFKHTHTHIHT